MSPSFAFGLAAIAALLAASPLHAQQGGQGPPPPSELTATPVSSTRIDLSWSRVEDGRGGDDDDDDDNGGGGNGGRDVIGYRIYRDGAFIASTDEDETEYSDRGLQPGTTYSYQVSTVDERDREGERSSAVTATTPADDTPPPPPQGLEAAATGPREIELSWSAVEDPESGIAEYRVYREGDFLAATTGTAYSDTDVEPQATYGYRVSAVNGEGMEGERSSEARVTTPAEPDATPPTAPGDLVASAVGPTRVDLAWSAASDPESGIAEYRVFRDGEPVGSTSETSFSDSGLEPETAYRYRVTAVNGEGTEGPPSEEAEATTPAAGDDSPPPAPQGLVATATDATRVDLSWTPVEDPESGIAEYRIYRDGARVGSTVTAAFSDTGLSPETRYRYRVSAVNGEGVEGPQSVEVEATTPALEDTVPPAAPTGLRVVS